MVNHALLAFTADDHWQPGIGDPTVIGWVTICCLDAALVSKKGRRLAEARFWFLFTGLAVFLGINKQLDLQTWFTLFGKHLAEEEGWYGQHRSFQAAFIAAIAVMGLLALIICWRLARERVKNYRLALCGGMFLGCFILIRAASFHSVDRMLGISFSNLTVNCMLELGGILCLAVAAVKSRSTSP